MNLLAYYVHNLNPVLIRFHENVQIRWYGISYICGFFAAWWLLKSLVRSGRCQLKPDAVTDFITYAAVFGVFLGGRLGYMLLYAHEQFFANPLIFFHFLSGGMASHRGIAGLAIFSWVYAKRNRISWTGLGDNVATVAPIGVMLGRFANFVNGELYGRVANLAWSVQFPTELNGETAKTATGGDGMTPYEIGQTLQGVGEIVGRGDLNPAQVIELSRTNPQVREYLAEVLPARHPSQIYQAMLEGLSLFLILWIIRWRWKHAPHGLLTAIFFAAYAVFRIIGEQFRFPESGFGPGGVLTKGQFYSLFLFAAAAGFLIWALTGGRREAQKQIESTDE